MHVEQEVKPAVTAVPAPEPLATRWTRALARHWLLTFALVWGAWVALPWLAPVAMKLGAGDAAQAIYSFYSLQCHQLPERSYFLFGDKTMYSLSEIQAAFQPTYDPLVLRQFIGNDQMGWKVAWSDRMVSLYTSVLLGMALYGLLRRRLPLLPVWGFILLIVPMALDGGSHAVSDLLGRGVGLGFRDTNAWLAALTGHAFSSSFYVGDALGSFNWLMRLVTGVIMGLAVVWLTFPWIELSMADLRRDLEDQAGRRLP